MGYWSGWSPIDMPPGNFPMKGTATYAPIACTSAEKQKQQERSAGNGFWSALGYLLLFAIVLYLLSRIWMGMSADNNKNNASRTRSLPRARTSPLNAATGTGTSAATRRQSGVSTSRQRRQDDLGGDDYSPLGADLDARMPGVPRVSPSSSGGFRDEQGSGIASVGDVVQAYNAQHQHENDVSSRDMYNEFDDVDQRPGCKLGAQQFEYADAVIRNLEGVDEDQGPPKDSLDRYYRKLTKNLPKPTDMIQARQQIHEDMWEGGAGATRLRVPKLTSPTGDSSTEVVIQPPPDDLWMNMPVLLQRPGK